MFLASGNRELGFYSVLIWLVVSELSLSYTSAWSDRTGLTVELERTPAVHKRYDLSMYIMFCIYEPIDTRLGGTLFIEVQLLCCAKKYNLPLSLACDFDE